MTRTRRWAFLVGLIAAAALPVAAVAAPNPPQTTIHGVNFQVKSQLDQSFCIQIDSGTTEGRQMFMQQCGLTDTQRWVLSADVNSENEMLDSQGYCVDITGRKAADGIALAAFLCQHDRNQELIYSSTAQLEFPKQGLCLSIPQAAANAPVSLQVCDPTKTNQLWVPTH